MEVVPGVAASGKGCGELWEVGGGVKALGRGGDAVEVGTEADVVDAGGARDVVDVVDVGAKRRAGDASGELSVDSIGKLKGHGAALAGEGGGEKPVGGGSSRARCVPGETPALIGKGGEEVDHDGTAGACDGA